MSTQLAEAATNRRGAAAGLAAAALFGLSTPLAKLLLPGTGPVMLAALLYLGAGTGLALATAIRRRRGGAEQREAPVRAADAWLLAGVILCGGVLGPILMLGGLARVSATVAALLLNLETPFTMLLAVFLFGEHLGQRGRSGAALIVVGALVLTYRPGDMHGDVLGVLAITAACLSWALDNNLTQRLSLRDPVTTVCIKALAAGCFNLGLSMALGAPLPPPSVGLAALTIGFVCYGVSIVLDVHALRLLGAAREAAFFATAPFVGAVAAVSLLAEPLSVIEPVAAAVMAAGVALLLRERHDHLHTHEPLEHDHVHAHDAHHQHAHPGPADAPHAHPHWHPSLTHDHPHVSDLHHRHRH